MRKTGGGMTALYGVAVLVVSFGTVAMSLHKLADSPVLEILFWALALVCLMFFEILLHYPLR